MRGVRLINPRTISVLGLIPARAGSTLKSLARLSSPGAHPRPCGEHLFHPHARDSRGGSSPPVRGVHHDYAPRATEHGLIPAHAGNMQKSPGSRTVYRAHPRSRGEHLEISKTPQLVQGSSPLARGTHNGSPVSLNLNGLIPARAGNTTHRPPYPWHRRAHPRSRGEHFPLIDPELQNQGSSPLARGTPPLGGQRRPARGLIPARAGNTKRVCSKSSPKWAHPRSRGEHCVMKWTAWATRGSSPLARGTQRFHVHGSPFVGLIPARAGNTFWWLFAFISGLGSSPLARGTLG